MGGFKKFKKFGKKFVKTDKKIIFKTGKTIKHESQEFGKIATPVGKIATTTGTVLEVVGALTGQPEIIALGGATQVVGLGLQGVGALTRGDIGGAVVKTGQATGKAGKFSGDKKLKKVGKTTKDVGKVTGKIQKEGEKRLKKKQPKISSKPDTLTVDEESLSNQIVQTLKEQGLVIGGGTVQPQGDDVGASVVLPMDSEESAVAMALEDIAEETRHVEREVNDVEERIMEQSNELKTYADFENSLDTLDSFQEATQFLIRNKSYYNSLSSQDKARIVRYFNTHY